MGTADPWTLGLSAVASQIPDIDTSGSVPGRIFFPVSRWLEARYAHRSATHSFLATALVAIAFLPLLLVWNQGERYWALVIGYWMGWFGDVFTKSGVAAFFPHQARLVIPANPRLRLASGSRAESIVLGVLVLVAISSININSAGGIMRSFDQILGSQSGAMEIYQRESSKHQVFARIEGRHTITQQAIAGNYEVIGTVSQDLLVKDANRRLYRVGTSPEAQIAPERVNVSLGSPITLTTHEVFLHDQSVKAVIVPLGLTHSYITGRLKIDPIDKGDISLHGSKQFFQPLQQFGEDIEIESASPTEVLTTLGDAFATGNLIVRTIHVQPPSK
jgi:inner membrane protein